MATPEFKHLRENLPLWILRIVFLLIAGGIAGVILKQNLETSLWQVFGGMILLALVVIGLMAILLWVWMAETNRRGKSWARIVATILGALNIVFTLVGLLLGGNSGLVVAFSMVSAALAAVILYLLYRPDSSAYYEAVSDIRR